MILDDPEKEALELDTISANHLLRFLAGIQWDVKKTLDHLKLTEKWFAKTKNLEVRGRQDFPNIPPMRAFAMVKKDKVGRQNFFC